MAENQTALYNDIHDNWDHFRTLMPEMAHYYDEYTAESYKDGVVPAKYKRLMALCAAVVGGCRACQLFQTEKALALGATGEEFLEVLGVAANLGGTMGAGEATRVVGFLREKNVL